MNKQLVKQGGKRIIVVSTFSGMDLFLLGCVKAGMFPGYGVEKNFWASQMHAANFKHTDGSPVISFVNINQEEYKNKKSHTNAKSKKDQDDEVGIIDGQHVRTLLIQEVNGHNIRAAIEARYGKDIIIVLIGGPPCQDFSKLNSNKNVGGSNRNSLVFEYLRILEELRPDVALMEEVADFVSPQFKNIFDQFIAEALKLPYKFGCQEINSIHLEGYQSRVRLVCQFVHEKWNSQPIFPEAHPEKAKRIKDFLDIDYFFSGQYTDRIKNGNDFMCTVTSGSPLWFSKDGKKHSPTTDERLLCFGVKKGEYIIPKAIPQVQVRKATGNGVCVDVAYALAKAIIEQVLKLQPAGDGYWMPRDTDELVSASKMTINTSPLGQIHRISNAMPSLLQKKGYVLYEGKSLINGDDIVAVATLESRNEKTGNMVQLWILNANTYPIDAIKTGKDESVCGDCKLRQFNKGACYVYIGKEPQTVWKAWKSGIYASLKVEDYNIFTDRSIRFGAYGDPYALPVNLLQELKKFSKNTTGYTHQWRREEADGLKALCMASVDNTQEYIKAVEGGWRTFRIIKPEDSLMPDEILCPNLTSSVQCRDCKLCTGTSLKAKNIAIHVHGLHKKRFNAPKVVEISKAVLTETLLEASVANVPKNSIEQVEQFSIY